jgi:hypothetical protein
MHPHPHRIGRESNALRTARLPATPAPGPCRPNVHDALAAPKFPRSALARALVQRRPLQQYCARVRGGRRPCGTPGPRSAGDRQRLRARPTREPSNLEVRWFSRVRSPDRRNDRRPPFVREPWHRKSREPGGTRAGAERKTSKGLATHVQRVLKPRRCSSVRILCCRTAILP